MIRALLAALLLVLAPVTASATPGPDELMDDPRLEERARVLYTQLRCVVCQSQSLDDSNATLAEAMRAVVRERLLAGDADDEIRTYMRARYGDYVLMEPPFQANTMALWLMPFGALLIGGMLIFVFLRRQTADVDETLSAEEEASLQALLEEEGQER